jgi:hypothetical protein
VAGCEKKYTDPSSLRKHFKLHTKEDQEQSRGAKPGSQEGPLPAWQDQEASSNNSSSLGLLSPGGGEFYSGGMYRPGEEFSQLRRGQSTP